MEVPFRAIKDGVVVKMPELSETTETGIIKGEAVLAEEAKEVGDELEVVAVGPKVEEIKVGDVIKCKMSTRPTMFAVKTGEKNEKDEDIMDSYALIHEFDVTVIMKQ